MKKALLIAEKPSLMKIIKDVYIKKSLKHKMQCDIDFVALHGHILTLAEPNAYDEKYTKWDMNTLPIVVNNFKYTPTDPSLIKEIREKLKNNKYDFMINATDPEREGQNIFYSVYKFINAKLPVQRLWVNDLNEEPIAKALLNMKNDLKDKFLVNLTTASECRAYADWLVGMNFTRAISIKNYKLIPIGRVVTPTFNLLYRRELEIRNFKDSSSYKIQANFNEKYSGISERVFQTEAEATKVMKSLPVQGKVLSFNEKIVKNYAPLLYSLGTLQIDANKYLNFTLAKTLEIAQSLYLQKIITYPRTNCSYIPEGDAFSVVESLKLPSSVSFLTKYQKFTSAIKNADKEKFFQSKYVNNDAVSSHGAIILTGKGLDANLSVNEKALIELIYKRQLATFLPPEEVKKIAIETDISKEKFITNISNVVNEGYTAIYGGNKENNVPEPKLKVGQIVNVANYSIKKIDKVKPSRYTDATLINDMINIAKTIDDKELKSFLVKEVSEQGGIGTPATRASIVEKLLQNVKTKQGDFQLVERKGKSFHVTDYGMEIAEAIKDLSVSSAELTAEWEKKLLAIEEGNMTKDSFMKEINGYIAKELEDIKGLDIKSTPITQKTVNFVKGVCPICSGKVKDTANYYLCENYKGDNNCNFIVKKVLLGAKITKTDIEKILDGKTTLVKNFTKSDGDKFSAKLSFSDGKLVFNK